MTQKSEQTKARILRAATEEFARYGIAGARVDRIAAAAEANKNLIYMYFGSKDRLFDEVCEAAVERLVSTVPFDAHDLPGYAGKLFDFYRAHPELLRLARWQALERPEPAGMPGGRAATEIKLRELAKAQAEGVVDAGMPPESLLTLVLNLSAAWSDGSVEGRFDQEDPALVSARRHWVVVSVGRLARPPGPQAG